MPTTSTLSLFIEVGRMIRTRMEHTLPLPFAQCETLKLLGEHARPTMRDIAEHFRITAPSATALADELVKRGLMRREPNPTDRRRIELVLTAQGKRTLSQITAGRTRVLKQLLSTLNERDQADLNRVLGKIIQSQD